MRSEGPQYDSSNAARAAIQLTICVLIAIAFVVAQDQPPRLTAFSAGVPAGLATPAAPSVDLSATATRTPTPQKTSRPTSVPKAPLQNQAVQSVQIDPRVPRAAVLDQNPVALYHFDSQVGNQMPDATGNYTGTLAGTAMITNNALFGAGALYTNGRDGPGPGYVQVGNLGDLPAGTLEAYIDFSQACVATADSFSIISLGNGYGNIQALSLYVAPASMVKPNWLDFGLRDSQGNWHMVTSGINPCKYLAFGYADLPWPYDVWRFHHVAGTWGPRGLEIWVDGVLHGVGDGYHDPNFNDSKYFCVPQAQFGNQYGFPPNPNYPICPYPVFSQTPVPYAYTGGLAASAYQSLLIGCDGVLSCFKGRFDDVRISNVQRVFDVSVDPPSSPTPTQTPVVSTGPYSVDSLTTSLLHMDSSYPLGTAMWVPDEVNSTNGYGRLWGNAMIVPGGRFGNGLCVDGHGSYVELRNSAAVARGTVEAWVRLNDISGSFGIVSGDVIYGTPWDNFFLGFDSVLGNTLRFGIADADRQWYWAVSNVNPTTLVGAWHHVAGTWGERGLEVWIDGILSGTNAYNLPRVNDIGRYGWDPFTLGCDVWRGCMDGMVDEVRFSSVQRTFAPSVLGAIPLRRSFVPVAPGTGAQSPFQVFFPFVLVNPTPFYCH